MAEASRVIIKNNLPKLVKSLSPPQMKSFKGAIGLRVQNALTDKIKSGDGSWAPLSPAWITAKGHRNQWYHTGQLENAIEYELNDAGVRIGVLKHSSYPDTGTNVAVVAASLEYGTSKIPARPLFGPVFEDQADDIIDAAAADIKERVKKAKI